MKLSIYFESCHMEYLPESERPERAAFLLNYILSNYSDDEAFFKIDGRPVIFIYGYTLSLIDYDGWCYVIDHLDYDCILILDSFSPQYMNLFDGFHTYNPLDTPIDELLRTYICASLRCKARHKLFCATMLPGYCDTIIREPGYTVDREGGAFYRSRYDLCVASRPNFILITSWNEWHEGSEIEPSVEYGYQYLDSTLAFKNRWTGGTNISGKTKIERIDLHIYPNPFNSSCEITICNVGAIHELPLQNAQIAIYDLRGNIVAPFARNCGRGVFPKGGHEDASEQIVPNRGKMSEGQKGVYVWRPDETIPGGVYLVRASIPGVWSATMRVVYLK